MLRYFNACGADPEGELAERHDPETHLIPRALLAAKGDLPYLDVFGEDYPTEDGTCIRDYIHVKDLARAHVMAVKRLEKGGETLAVNLGSGHGQSVNAILKGIEQVTGRKVPARFAPRRPGDPPAIYADATRAARELGFRSEWSDLDVILKTAARGFGLEVRP